MKIFNTYYLYKVTWNYYNHRNRHCSVIQYLATDECTQSYAYNMLDDKYRNDMKLVEDITIEHVI